MSSDHIEVPEDHCLDDDDDDKRLWIGNLGIEITEYAIVKLLQKFGTLNKMNFVYNKIGPDKGKPKGYCFVSFNTWEAADKARKVLDGKNVMSRTLHVKWAHKIKQDEMVYTKSKSKPSLLSTTSSKPISTVAAAALSASSSMSAASAETKIAAIEAKLQMMERTQEEFSLNSTIKPPRNLNYTTSQSMNNHSSFSNISPNRTKTHFSTRPNTHFSRSKASCVKASPYKLPSKPKR